MIDKLLASTVLVKASVPDGYHYGSGVVVWSGKGKCVVLTNEHVIRGAGRVEIHDGSDRFDGVMVERKGWNRSVDIAMLWVDHPAGSWIPVAPRGTPVSGDLLVAGCPGQDRVPYPFATEFLGFESFKSHPSGVGQGISHTGHPKKGQSGGGILNDRGELVALISHAACGENKGLATSLVTDDSWVPDWCRSRGR